MSPKIPDKDDSRKEMDPIVPMNVNPGGTLSPENTVGRDEFIKELWNILRVQSLLLTSERRIGKTSIVTKMAEENIKGFTLHYEDVGGCSTSLEFVQKIVTAVRKHLSLYKKLIKTFDDFLRNLGGAQILGVKIPDQMAIHWKTLLEQSFKELAEQSSSIFVFAWDELPWMLQNIIETEGLQKAVDLLSILRAARHHHPKNIRMIYTGSIGIHHILKSLKDQGKVNAPINDMEPLQLPPLDMTNAQRLAGSLILGEELHCEDFEAGSAIIAKAGNCIPFYIQHIINFLTNNFLTVTASSVNDAISNFIQDHRDPLGLSHFSDRLISYYPEFNSIIRKLLCVISRDTKGMTFEELSTVVQEDMGNDKGLDILERRKLKEWLKSLQQDHYLNFNKITKCYHFQLELNRLRWQEHEDI